MAGTAGFGSRTIIPIARSRQNELEKLNPRSPSPRQRLQFQSPRLEHLSIARCLVMGQHKSLDTAVFALLMNAPHSDEIRSMKNFGTSLYMSRVFIADV